MIDMKFSTALLTKYAQYEEMINFFYKRTDAHIARVQKYCKEIYDYDPERFNGLVEQGEEHDQSKLKDPELVPYIYVTWDYKCKDDGTDWTPPEGVDEQMNIATEHHVNNNRHHPEFHSNQESNIINRSDRDKPPEEVIDATKMGDLDIGEMCADWMGMSEERGEDGPRGWADKNVNVRWKFTDDQKNLIYELINNVWGR